MKGLSEHADAIKLYWDMFPYQEGDKGVEDSLRLDFAEKNTELYMPLGNLIKVTTSIKQELGPNDVFEFF